MQCQKLDFIKVRVKGSTDESQPIKVLDIKPKGSTDHKLYRLYPRLRMTSRINHLQLAKLHLSARIANTKSMTPNQSRFRASGFKGFRHIPLGPCSGFMVKRHDFYFSFSSFLFLFSFSFLFHMEDSLVFIHG